MMNQELKPTQAISFSGIYPHIAWTNGDDELKEWECGTGALVPWAGKLWFITYPAHQPFGSKDKLYALNPDLSVDIHPLSVGGTHANRMIHKESNQLIIGPYFIDAHGSVKAIAPEQMPGRLTAVTRSLHDPENKVIFYTMESGLYEVHVHTLQVTTWYRDPNHLDERAYLLPGVHGKGAYTGQNRLVVSNNGEGGALAEWNGEGDPALRENWTIVDANKYTEITGPGGLYGSPDANAPLWALGWDHKSVLLNVCEKGSWTRYRLPMGSYTHSADDGWFTEWPRIRHVGNDQWLMDMFGMMYEFPPTFSTNNTAGVRPICTHHKMIVDFDHWNGHLVLGCNDASIQRNPLLGRCQSNLLFTSLDKLQEFGKPSGWGGVWAKEDVRHGVPSEAFQFAGFEQRILHLSHGENAAVSFTVELDKNGTGDWAAYRSIKVPVQGYAFHLFPVDLQAEWIRIVPGSSAAQVSAYFYYSPEEGNPLFEEINKLLTDAGASAARSEGILYASDDMNLPLHVASAQLDEQGNVIETGFYEVNADMRIRSKTNPAKEQQLREELAPSCDFLVDEASVMITDPDNGQRYRLPKGHAQFDQASDYGARRGIREVVTERMLMNLHGTFYELPDERSGGMSSIQPICTHNKLIYDFCSWRGMLVLSGVSAAGELDDHTVASEDGRLRLWLGNVDDLRKFGPPQGVGGPLHHTAVKANEPSDPYLMVGYQKKSVDLSHTNEEAVIMTIEVDFQANGSWAPYADIAVPAGQKVTHTFPDGYSAHWVRVRTNQDTTATATFIYR